MNVFVMKPSDLLKSKYLSKKRGKDGKWVYDYNEKKGRRSAKPTVGVIRPKDKKQIKVLAEQIAERTFDNNNSTVQPNDNKELMTAIASHETEYGEESRGILLQGYAKRYNKLNDLLYSEGDSFRRDRKKNKPLKEEDRESGKGSGRNKRYMKTIRNGKESAVREVIINDEGFVIEIDGKVIDPTPIEDYGDYHLSESKDKVFKKKAFK